VHGGVDVLSAVVPPQVGAAHLLLHTCGQWRALFNLLAVMLCPARLLRLTSLADLKGDHDTCSASIDTRNQLRVNGRTLGLAADVDIGQGQNGGFAGHHDVHRAEEA